VEIELGRRADYAIRAVVDLARHHGDGLRKAREIAEEMAIPGTFLPQILAELVRVGIATSVAGREGGYALARPPEEVSLLEVITAVDGEPATSACILRGGPCRWDDVCAVHVPWARAKGRLRQELAQTSLRDVARIDARIEAGTFVVPEELRSDPLTR
jgi:Rrf2 family protein